MRLRQPLTHVAYARCSDKRVLSVHAASASVIDVSPTLTTLPLAFDYLHKRICNARSIYRSC
jgi:hypothetical protein